MYDDKQQRKEAGSFQEPSPWALAGLGMQFAVALVLFGYIGQWLDGRFNTSPVFLLAAIVLGAGGSFYLSYRRIMIAARRSTPDRIGKDEQEGG